MSLQAIGRMFRNIAGEVIENQYEEIEFIWHGGEPLLIPLDYYDAIGELQREIFSDRVKVSNLVQSNLTVLTDRQIEHLKAKRFFADIGVSIDVYGDQRVDKRGRQTTRVALANMQRLRDAEIPFGAIVVVARNNLPHIREIYRFFDQIDVGVRFLPFFLNATDDAISRRQIDDHALTYGELVDAFKALVDEWLASSSGDVWSPLDEYLNAALAHISGKQKYYYDRLRGERVFIVNIDGRVWGTGDSYLAERVYGNLFEEEFASILKSSNRKSTIEQAQRRMSRYCEPCPYYGACPGFFVADASPQEELLLAKCGCPAREMIEHILHTLEQTKISAMLTQSPHAERTARSAPPGAPT